MRAEGFASGDTTFAVTTELCPQILCRLLGLIAQQGRIVDHAEVRRRPNCLLVRVSVADMEAHHAEILAEKMRSLVPVRKVALLTRASVESL